MLVSEPIRKIPTWENDKPTESQMAYIKHIWEESDMPLPPFTGKTKGEAAEWIAKNKIIARKPTKYYNPRAGISFEEADEAEIPF